MQVEQITYGSAKRRIKGYQIIGKSPGVDATTAAAFCRFAPSHSSLEVPESLPQEQAWGLSYFPLSDQKHVIARSVHGGPEYSGRGGLAVVTSALILTSSQLEGYEYHAIDLARTAVALGFLILPSDNRERLSAATLTGQPVSLMLPASDFTDSSPALLPSHAVNWIAREACSLLRDGNKVMIVGQCDPLPILTLLFDQLTPEERQATSFSSGIKPSNRREFQVQFTFQPFSRRLEKDLQRSGIAAIDLARVLVESL